MSQVTPRRKRQIRHMLSTEKPTVRIGKGGTTPEIVKEIEKQLKRNKMVKIKILRTALVAEETKQIAEKTAQQTSSSLIEIRGHTFILYRRNVK